VNSRRLLPALLLLFVGSGCAALIYEVVWFQLLELVIGSSAVSMGVLLGTFMGGMCLGSFLLPRFIAPAAHPLRVYAWLELGIGAFGLLILFGMPIVGGAYTAWAGSGIAGTLLRGAAAAICLLPPTLLMGATLPAIARWVERTPDGVAWLGFFYGGNTAGAVFGSLLAGYYLLSSFDISVATYVAVVLNVSVAMAAMTISSLAPYDAIGPALASLPEAAPARRRQTLYLVAALSGFTALACEVIWTRLLSLLLGGTVYTFALILAVFLGGLGLGSSIGSFAGRHLKDPAVALGWCQLGLTAAMAWSAYALMQSLPYWPVNPSVAPDAWYQFQLDLVRCLFAVLPGALLWGASFPLALASVASDKNDPARLVGGVYAANTLGAILGSLSAGLVLIVWLGTQRSQQLLVLVAAASGLLALAHARLSTLTFVTACVFAGAMAVTVRPIPGIFVAYGRFTATQLGQAEVIYVGEGWTASVAVSERKNGVRNYHNAGKVQASSEPQDMRLQRMLGHLTTLVPKKVDTVLVIGCGAGVTAGAVSIDPAVKHETIAEIEPLVPRVVSTYFADHNFDVVRNPKVNVHLDDARHFLFTTKQKFDAITSDPLDPWVKGAAMLYTREFFELVKSRLNPGGIVTLFVQLYESNTEAVKSEVATFFEAFPKGMIFANTYNGGGYDLVLLGQVDGTTINLDDVDARLRRPDYEPIRRSLSQIGMFSAMDLFATYGGSAEDMKPWTADAQINRDRNLRLQYLAGRGLNLYRAEAIYAEMLPHAKEPGDIFEGSDHLKNELLQKIHAAWGR
jgi:spermidine synthase